MSEVSYVYDGTEIKRTGKQAQKTLSSGKIDTLVEITPIHTFNGSWKKWVRESELYQVVGDDLDE
jgi:hypothetical protein